VDEILSFLSPGDTMTHCFHGLKHQVLDDGGKVLPGVWDAVERGVNLDVGHGRGSFVFTTAER
jgi:dihydroorotase